MDGGNDVVAGRGDGFYFLGAQDEPDIGEKRVTEHLRNRDDDHAVLFRDGQYLELKSRALWNHVQDRWINMECVEVNHRTSITIPAS